MSSLPPGASIELTAKTQTGRTLADFNRIPRHGSKTLPGIVAAYVFLGLIAAVACLVLVKIALSNTRVEHVYVDRTVVRMADLQKALGTPGQIVDGTQLGLKAGTICRTYSKPDGFYVLCS